MRRLIAAALTLSLLTLVPNVAPQPAAPDVRLSELLAAPATGEPEFVELHNAGGAVDLTGWAVEDDAGNRYTFAAWTLPAGGHVVVWSGPGAASDSRGPLWSESRVWNNDGDAVRLFDPTGTLVDELLYGAEPNATVAAPAAGVSLQRIDGAWHEGEPTPGFEPAVQGGDITAEVIDVPPRIASVSAPAEVRRGEAFSLGFTVEEDNGEFVTWAVRDGSGTLVNGTGTGTHVVALAAPETPGVWSLVVAAADANETTEAVAVTVRASDLEIDVEGPLDLPAFAPGARNITTPAFTIRNVGPDPVTPILDLSPLRSGSAEVPVDGNVVVTLDDGTGPVTVAYLGPMTPLAPIAGGAEVDVTFTFVDIPVPLAAGTYGTSFTVVSS